MSTGGSPMSRRTIHNRGAAPTPEPSSSVPAGTSRRDFLKSSGGLAAAAALPTTVSGATVGASAAAAEPAKPSVRFPDAKRKVLKGGIVLTLDGTDYEKADVVIEGKKIVGIG